MSCIYIHAIMYKERARERPIELVPVQPLLVNSYCQTSCSTNQEVLQFVTNETFPMLYPYCSCSLHACCFIILRIVLEKALKQCICQSSPTIASRSDVASILVASAFSEFMLKTELSSMDGITLLTTPLDITVVCS